MNYRGTQQLKLKQVIGEENKQPWHQHQQQLYGNRNKDQNLSSSTIVHNSNNDKLFISHIFDADNISKSIDTTETAIVRSLASIVDDSDHGRLRRFNSLRLSSSLSSSMTLMSNYQSRRSNNNSSSSNDDDDADKDKLNDEYYNQQYRPHQFSTIPASINDDIIISANSIISSWFFTINQCDIGFCMANLRNRLYDYNCNVNNAHAGNYVNAMIFTPHTYTSPYCIQHCTNTLDCQSDIIGTSITNTRRSNCNSVSNTYSPCEKNAEHLPQLLNNNMLVISSMSVNWANFYRDEMTLHPSISQKLHIPLYTSNELSTQLPHQLSAINVFTASSSSTNNNNNTNNNNMDCAKQTKRRAGVYVLCTETIWNEKIVPCGIIDEIIC
jgi:hypothetical protein